MPRTSTPVSVSGVVPAAVLALILVGGGCNRQESRPVEIASGPWKPFVHPDLPGGGPLASIVREALLRCGIKCVITFENGPHWDQVRNAVRDRKVVAGFPFSGFAFKNSQEIILSKVPLAPFEYVMWSARSPDDRLARLVRLVENKGYEQLTVGVPGRYLLWEELKDKTKTLPCKDTLEALQKLEGGEVDLVVEARRVGHAVIGDPENNLNAADFLIFNDHLREKTGRARDPVLGKETSLHLGTSVHHRRFLERFDERLKALLNEASWEKRANLRGKRSRVEVLPGPEGYAPARRAGSNRRASRQRIHLPAGSLGVVVEWPPSFRAELETVAKDEDVFRLKLLNGPRRGQVVEVHPRFVRIVHKP
jgi:hypothetical protein